MKAKDQEIRTFALDRLLAGDSYRKTIAITAETFGQSVSLSTLNDWANEDPARAHEISQAHLRAVGHGRVRLARKALDMLEEAIDNGKIPPSQIPATFGIVQDKLDNLVKMTEDRRHDNELLQQLRMQLRAKPPHELKALALTLHDDKP